MFFFFCKQKTAYEMRISDWSSDVCSSDLRHVGETVGGEEMAADADRAVVGLVAGLDLPQRSTGRDAERAGDIGRCRYIIGRQQIGRASCRERVCQYV